MFIAACLAAVAVSAADLPLGHERFVPSPEHTVGFRGDWTGRYPGAEPPLEWSREKNLVWRTTVGIGESSPIVVGDRLFIVADGIRLLCVRKRDGEVLWTREHHLRRDVADEAGLWPLEEYVLRYHKLRPTLEELRRLEQTIERLRGKPEKQKQPGDDAEIAAGEKRLAELQPVAAAGEAEMVKLIEAIPVENVSGQFSKLSGSAAKPNALTGSIATPASDGQRVYAWLPTGVVACYDMQGNRQWVQILGKRRAAGGWYGGQVMPSPVLVDGKLVVHYDQIYCLDAVSGKRLWTTPQRVLCLPSPVAGRRNGHWYIGLGTMQVLRLCDGQFVHGDAKGPWHDLPGVGSPIAFGDMICWTSHAVRLPEGPDGMAEVAWQLDVDTADAIANNGREPDDGKPYVFRGMGWHHYGSPLELSGTIYYHHERGMFSGLEAATGKLRFTDVVKLGKGSGRQGRFGGEVYPGLLMAGGHFFAQGGNGMTAILRPDAGRGFTVVGENQIERFGGNMLTFSGRRLFVRTGGTLWCFGE